MPCGATVPWQTALSLARTTRFAAQNGVPLDLCVTAGGSVVSEARNLVLNSFMSTKADILLWIDSDIEWSVADFVSITQAAHVVDVVCATYPAKTTSLPFIVKQPDPDSVEVNGLGLVKIDGTGLGFCAVTRKVLEKLVERAGRVDIGLEKDVPDVFRIDRTVTDGRRTARGEDMAFFADVRELGCDVWLDPTIQLGHAGNFVFRGDPVVALGLQDIYHSSRSSEHV
jgi:hypothetical protein